MVYLCKTCWQIRKMSNRCSVSVHSADFTSASSTVSMTVTFFTAYKIWYVQQGRVFFCSDHSSWYDCEKTNKQNKTPDCCTLQYWSYFSIHVILEYNIYIYTHTHNILYVHVFFIQGSDSPDLAKKLKQTPCSHGQIWLVSHYDYC